MFRLSVLCFSFLVALSCKQTPKVNSVSEDHDKSSTSFEPGQKKTFVTTDAVGTAEITFVTESSFSFYITVVTKDANCIGEIEGLAQLENDTFLYSSEDSECRLSFQVASNRIVIDELGSECDHGALCSFAGTYTIQEPEAPREISKIELSNIEEYFLALPDSYFTCELDETYSMKKRNDFITYKNNNAGYLKFSTPELSEVELALFVDKSSGRKFLAYVYECGAGCMCTRREFLVLENGEWQNIFGAAFPSIPADDDSELDYQLPEKGTDIIVKSGKKEVVLQWKNGKFEIKQ